jgi:hypothetical protein
LVGALARACPVTALAALACSAALAAALAVGSCGGPRPETHPGSAGATAGYITMTRLQACYDVVEDVCAARRGCLTSHPQNEYACRDWLLDGCCREQGTCDEQVAVSSARLDACHREIEQGYDCNKLFTPACHRVIPGPQEKQDASARPQPGLDPSILGRARPGQAGRTCLQMRTTAIS